MPDNQNTDLIDYSVNLSDFTLRIPGEHFFCDSVSLPPMDFESDEEAKKFIENFVRDLFENKNFSPYPVDQLSYGYFHSEDSDRVFVYACPLVKLSQLGWQNLEVFRRVFPSFISAFGKVYDEPSVLFLLEEDSLSILSFEKGCGVPAAVYSMSVEEEDEKSIEIARGKLLSLIDLEHYQVIPDILVAKDVVRQKDGYFRFEQEWLKGSGTDLELDQTTLLNAEDLWACDLRTRDFKKLESKRRKQAAKRWQYTQLWSLGMAAIMVLFLGLKVFQVKLSDRQILASAMGDEVPLVLESKKLLDKLEQNQLGGIDPFGAISRLYPFLGGSGNDLHVWFTSAHFESRREIKIKGEGKNIESINNFLEKLETNKVAILKTGSAGDERRKIRSKGGKTIFEVEIELIEQNETSQLSNSTTSETPLENKEG